MNKILSLLILTSLFPISPRLIAKNYSTRKVDIQEEISGKQLYQSKCTKCHKLIEPKKFKQEKWEKMIKKMQKRAKINDVEREKIYSYIVSSL